MLAQALRRFTEGSPPVFPPLTPVPHPRHPELSSALQWRRHAENRRCCHHPSDSSIQLLAADVCVDSEGWRKTTPTQLDPPLGRLKETKLMPQRAAYEGLESIRAERKLLPSIRPGRREARPVPNSQQPRVENTPPGAHTHSCSWFPRDAARLSAARRGARNSGRT